jgi:OmpA-OmpF porin, OOP family
MTMAISLIRTTLLSFTSAALLIGCASTTYNPTPFTPANMDASAYNPKVDAFVVVMDASSSMNYSDEGRKKFHSAKDVVSHMNQTIPELNYKSALVGFGSNSCLNWESNRVVSGPATHRTADFSNGLNMLECAGGVSPMEDGVYAGGSTVQGSGQIALILVSDFLNINTDAVVAKVDALEAEYGDRLCIHSITVGGAEASELTAALADVNGCGSSVNAASLASSAAMAGFVSDVLLEPAPAAPVVNYEKSTISASALFDYDSSVLKEEGKVAMSDLKKSIKARDSSVVNIDIIGHTDNTGSEEYNMDLSIRRAESVREYMVSKGVDASKINVYGEGETNPVASNETREGRAENRRVDIQVGITQDAN